MASRKIEIALSLAALVVLAAFISFLMFAYPSKAGANPSSFCQDQNATASTSPVYITAGAATSTFLVENCGNTAQSIDALLLGLQVTASGTAPTLDVAPEFSFNLKDWYPLTQTPTDQNVNNATTTNVAHYGVQRFGGMASSTDMWGSGIGSTTAGTASNLRGARFHESISYKDIPAPYVRFKFSVPPGAAPVSVYAEAQARVQNR